MGPHTHPPYEETFNRIATILDVIAGSQAEHADAMAEIREIQKEQATAFTRVIAALERLTIKSAESEDKLNALIGLMGQHLNDHRKNG